MYRKGNEIMQDAQKGDGKMKRKNGKDQQALLAGMLLKMERLRQGRGQKEVCYGLCVPSYLSKIEHGLVQADPTLLADLFARLDIHYETDPAVCQEGKKALEEYFYRLHYHLEREENGGQWTQKDQRLLYSPLAADWLLAKGFAGEDVISLLEALWEGMDQRQQAYGKLLLWRQNPLRPDGIALCREACAVLDHAFAMGELCMAYLQQGKYDEIHRMESKMVAAAVTEGNTWQLANYFYINGTAYACLNLEAMMMDCFERSIHLLQNTAWQQELADLYYNIGATYISLEKYAAAWQYLEKAEQVGEGTSAPLLHKQSIVLIRSGQLAEAQKYLQQLKRQLEAYPTAGESDWLKYEEACMECRKDFEQEPEYLQLLERLIETLRTEQHPGHLYFYREVVVRAYTAQRKYKKALEFEQWINSFK